MKPTKRQQEALDLLQEECAEIIQIISKIRRFGLDSVHQAKSNYQQLTEELTDFKILVDYLQKSCGMDIFCSSYADKKLDKLQAFTGLFPDTNALKAFKMVDIEGSLFERKQNGPNS